MNKMILFLAICVISPVFAAQKARSKFWVEKIVETATTTYIKKIWSHQGYVQKVAAVTRRWGMDEYGYSGCSCDPLAYQCWLHSQLESSYDKKHIFEELEQEYKAQFTDDSNSKTSDAETTAKIETKSNL